MNAVPKTGLGTVRPPALESVRQEAHRAVQLVSAVGHSLLPARPDSTHSAVTWDPDRDTLRSEPVPLDEVRIRAALDVAGFRVFLKEDRRGAEHAVDLRGRTVVEVLGWMNATLAEISGKADLQLELPGFTMPAHAIDQGGRFGAGPGEESTELARWLAHAASMLREQAALDPRSSRVTFWPHHFDGATLTTYDTEIDPEEARSIGVGFSPGDEAIPEPYWYVLPWPAERMSRFPAIEGPGAWVREPFVGAKLLATEILEDARDPESVVRAFVDQATAGARRILEVE